ncbi:MAG: TonB-dependent receptor [Polymorphobacter sp.]|uniref:TonB-dependent receptor n=1 Tax=Polymorphobacter sp. TaxID=1909290 RepID=UPI003A8B5DF6
MINANRAFWCASAAIAALAATPAFAQTNETAASETAGSEIIVTARKREESLQNVPISVQAFTSDALEASNITNLESLAAFAPGVQLFQNVDRGYGQVFIRGLQNTPPVGDTTRELASIFIDGIYFTGGVATINTDNIERVEVVRGPQSALFGRSTFSGAINFITKTPGNEFGAQINATAATFDDYSLSAAFDLPLITDKLAARVSGRFRDAGGQYTNGLDGSALGEQQDLSLTGQLYITPSERLSAKISVSYTEQRDGAAAAMLVGRKPTHNFTMPNGNTTFRGELRPTGAPPIQNVFPADPNKLLIFPPFPAPVVFDSRPGSDRLGLRRNGLDRSFFFTSLLLDYEVADGYTLSYNGGYSNEVAERLWDFELSPEDNYYGSRRTNSESHSHEIKLASPADARFTWLIGAAYFNQKLYERDPGGIFGSNAFGFLAGFPGSVFVGAGPRVIVDRNIDNYAVFGSLGYQFTDQLSLSVEGRWQRDELTDTVNRATGEQISAGTNAFLPRAILEYQASPDLLLYASAAKGLRPTTINSQFAGRTDAQKARIQAEFPELNIDVLAPPETIWSYELGLKSTLMDGRMTFNANAYYSDWSESQDLRSLLADIDGNGVPVGTLVTVSGPDIEAYGLELDTAIRASDAVTLGGSFAWNHTKLTGDQSEANQARFLLQTRPNGERLAQTPEFSGSAFAQYDGAISDTAGWFLRAEGIYVGSRYASSLNLTETGDSFDLNLRLGFELENYTATFFVTNLLQDETFESLRSNADCATTSACFERAFEAVLPNKRQFGVNLRAKF